MAAAFGGEGRRRTPSDDWFTSSEKFPELKRPRVLAQKNKNEFAEYYIMSSAVENHDLKKVSPFLIEKALTTYVGDGTITKRLRDGQLLIKCKNEKQAQQLLAMKSLGGQINVKVEEHKTLNVCKGIVYCDDLRYMDEVDILNELSSQKVTEVRKIKKRVNGELLDTALCVFTFKLSSLPEILKVGFHHCPVKLYIPNPLRCLNCFKYGHTKKFCKDERVCALCSEPYHENECKTANKCINCKVPQNNHNNWSKSCDRYKTEYEIQKLSVIDKISNFEARKKFKMIHPDFAYPTYASKVNGIAFAKTNSTEKDTNTTKQSIQNETTSRNHAPTKINNTQQNETVQNKQNANNLKDHEIQRKKFNKLTLTPNTTITIPTNESSLSTENSLIKINETITSSLPLQNTFDSLSNTNMDL